MREYSLLGCPAVCQEGGVYGQRHKKTRTAKGIKFWTEVFIFYSKFEFYPRIRGDVMSSVA